MFERLGRQLANQTPENYPATGNHLVLLLVFMWVFSGWLVVHNLPANPVLADTNLSVAYDGTDTR